MNDRIPHAEPDHVLVDVKAKAFGGLRPALTPTPGAVPEQRAGCRPQDIHNSGLYGFRGLPPALQELHVDLGVYASEDRLVRAVFESERVLGWQSGSDSLCLTLDGFDEALTRMETLDRLLGEVLGWLGL